MTTGIMKKYDFHVKINMAGIYSSGKRSLLIRFFSGNFRENYKEEFELFIRCAEIPKILDIENKLIICQIFAPSGGTKYLSSGTCGSHIRKMQGWIIVYDITNLESFNEIKKLNQELNDNCSPGIKKILVGNKCDLESERKVTEEEGKKLANELGINFFEVSAKTGKNVKEAFISLIKDIIINDKTQENKIQINKAEPSDKKYKCAK